MRRSFIVREGDGATVGEVVRRAGADEAAIVEGRVFVGRRRTVVASEAVRVGDEVIVGDAIAPTPEVVILARTADLVVADKPAGMPTIPDEHGAAHALVAKVAAAIGVPVARLHATSRLDRDVSGVVTFALDARAAERLKKARARGEYTRRYVAIASRAPSPASGASGEWDAPIGRAKDPRHRRAFGDDAAPSLTRYRVVAVTAASEAHPSFALLALAPVTGRTHQLRVHAAHAGAPLVGDAVYGGPARLTLPSGKVLSPKRVALHCARVTLPQARGAPLRVDSPIPAALLDLWLSLGGDAAAWDIALSCSLGASPSP